MSQELVPAGPLALKREEEEITLDGYVLQPSRFFVFINS